MDKNQDSDKVWGKFFNDVSENFQQLSMIFNRKNEEQKTGYDYHYKEHLQTIIRKLIANQTIQTELIVNN